jgi:ankyrin repeat protein
MATVSRGLPKQPHLDVPKRQARELLNQWRAGVADAFDRIRRRHPKLHAAGDAVLKAAAFRLSDAQLVVAREYGFSTWAQLKERISAHTIAGVLDAAIRAGDRDTVVDLLRANPNLLHVPVVSGNWGPPMSHAANLGRMEIIKAVAELGARDFQHAFDRALLQGKIECAKWLHEHGAKPVAGTIMGSCETLNAVGFRFLVDLGTPLADEHGNRLAPPAMVLETYSRNPAGKHEILKILSAQGYSFPDTPMMAFHQGNAAKLDEYLRRDPRLIERRFSYSEIYPPALGCAADGQSGLHWTPIAGTTLLHLTIDFNEWQIFDLLLARGADVNARANVDSAGFGGHTPLFNAVVCGPRNDVQMTRALLAGGASRELRASLRKFLDWTETPRWHESRDVTPVEWARTFPEQSWVNAEALELLTSI